MGASLLAQAKSIYYLTYIGKQKIRAEEYY